jgi:hypothetical protein
MKLSKSIDDKMDEMWERRQNQILEPLGIKSDGANKKWNIKIKSQLIYELMDLIEKYLTEKNPRLLKRYNSAWEYPPKRFIILRGSPDRRKQQAKEWMNEAISQGVKKDFIYILWKGDKCLYVGQSTTGGNRFGGHHKSDPWMNAHRLEVRIAKNKKQLDFLECMTIHLYSPFYNSVLVHKQSGRSPCEICKKLRKVEDELKFTFALK